MSVISTSEQGNLNLWRYLNALLLIINLDHSTGKYSLHDPFEIIKMAPI